MEGYHFRFEHLWRADRILLPWRCRSAILKFKKKTKPNYKLTCQDSPFSPWISWRTLFNRKFYGPKPFCLSVSSTMKPPLPELYCLSLACHQILICFTFCVISTQNITVFSFCCGFFWFVCSWFVFFLKLTYTIFNGPKSARDSWNDLIYPSISLKAEILEPRSCKALSSPVSSTAHKGEFCCGCYRFKRWRAETKFFCLTQIIYCSFLHWNSP